MYDIKGMSCAMCKNTIEKNINKIDGLSANIDLMNNKLYVEGDRVDDQLVVNTVNNLGYEVVFDPYENKHKYRLILSIILMLTLMYFSMGHMFGAYMFGLKLVYRGLIQMILTIIIFIIHRHYFASGFKSLIKLTPNMDTLIFLSSSSAFIYSLYAMFKINNGFLEYHLYFETGAMILVIVSIGKHLEKLSKLKTVGEISKLAALKPKFAKVIRDGEVIDIRVDEVLVGDLIEVRQGEVIPIDCIIIEGETEVNESLISGESLPILKGINDQILGGSINIGAYIKAKVIHHNGNNVLDKIIKMCQEVGSNKLPIERIVDRISAYFVPSIIVIALVTFIVWFLIGKDFELAMNYALSVLVISCPCALGLATPSAIAVAGGVASKQGILLKNAAVLEKIYDLKNIVMDKTGTLTENKLTIVKSYFKDETAKRMVKALETKSNHPIAKSIVEDLGREFIDIDYYVEKSGRGIEASIGNDSYLLGNIRLFNEHQIIVDEKIINEAQKAGYSYLLYAFNHELCAYIYFSDVLKNTSKEAVGDFNKRGVNVIMCTGDNDIVAKKMAKELQINSYFSMINPDDKYDIVKKTKVSGLTAMVGDGINDAIALSEADIAITLGSGSDLAFEVSDVVLMKNDLTDIIYLMDISKMTMRIIKQNLFWSLFYNSLLIPMAAGLFGFMGIKLNPMFGAIMMSISSIVVLSNALRINKLNKKEVNGMKEVKIEGMMCGHCEKHVTDSLAKLGIKATVSKDSGKAIFSDNGVDDTKIKSVIEDAGYKVIEITNNKD